MQAQDYPGTLWAIGLRLPQATQATIEQAIADKTIVRSWPMRGTLHFVAPQDLRWMLALLTPRIIAGSASRYRQLELDEATFVQSQEVLIRALQGGKILIRPEIFAVLEQGNISTAGQRGYHILGRLSQQGLLCFGPNRDKQPTFVLLDEWIPAATAKKLEREEALAELAKRYFTGHGPATVADLGWWAGLKITEARAGLEMVKATLEHIIVDGQTYWFAPNLPAIQPPEPSVYLLPGFDEYLLGYKDRRLVLPLEHSQKIVPGNNGMFMPTIVSGGQIVGTWKRTIKKDRLIITPEPFNGLNQAEIQSLEIAAEGYGRFMGLPQAISK